MLRIFQVSILILLFIGVYAQETGHEINNKSVTFFTSDTTNGAAVMLNDSITIELVKVSAGSFTMGSEKGYSNEMPLHRVTLDEFYIGTYEVSQKLWHAVMGANPAHFNDCPDCPVEMISYADATDFIERLNRLTGLMFRLPTEAEWEYAANGGTDGKRTRYSGSYKVIEVAWYERNAENRTHPVGLKMANELGIYDMSGNVYEWTQDWMGRYKRKGQVNPLGAERGKMKVIRGGCWYDTRDGCSIHCRVEMNPSDKNGCLGLRLAHNMTLNE